VTTVTSSRPDTIWMRQNANSLWLLLKAPPIAGFFLMERPRNRLGTRARSLPRQRQGALDSKRVPGRYGFRHGMGRNEHVS
jgi:hypothetical protein